MADLRGGRKEQTSPTLWHGVGSACSATAGGVSLLSLQDTVASSTTREIPIEAAILFLLICGFHRSTCRREGSGLASLITESWNPLVECLKRLETLRKWVQVSPECGLKPRIRELFYIPALY